MLREINHPINGYAYNNMKRLFKSRSILFYDENLSKIMKRKNKHI